MKHRIALFALLCTLGTSHLECQTPVIHVELTDHILPRISPQVSQQFYQMLQEIDLLFKNKEVTYWLTAGSLLGAVRHQGMIPWDDDIDLCIFDKDISTIISLRSDLHKLGYALYVSRDYIKIYLANGHSIPKKEGDFYPWKYPFVDLFPMKQEEDRVVYASERLRKGFPQDWFQAEHISKLLSVPFGALSIPIPNQAADYLERMYGQDVWEVAYADYNHAEEKRCEKVKVRLITKECAPYFDLPL